MSSPPHLSDDDDDHDVKAALKMDVLEVFGTLLAAVADLLEGKEISRRGGPGLYRRLASILVAFLTFAVLMQLRQRASSACHRVAQVTSKALYHLSHPPAGWAAP